MVIKNNRTELQQKNTQIRQQCAELKLIRCFFVREGGKGWEHSIFHNLQIKILKIQ